MWDVWLGDTQHDIVGFVGQMLAVVPRQQGKVVAVDGTFDVVGPAMVLSMAVFVLKIAIVVVRTFGPESKIKKTNKFISLFYINIGGTSY